MYSLHALSANIAVTVTLIVPSAAVGQGQDLFCLDPPSADEPSQESTVRHHSITESTAPRHGVLLTLNR